MHIILLSLVKSGNVVEYMLLSAPYEHPYVSKMTRDFWPTSEITRLECVAGTPLYST